MMMTLMSAFDAIGLRKLNAVANDTINGSDGDPISSDNLHVLFDVLHIDHDEILQVH